MLKGLYIWVLIGLLGFSACTVQNDKTARIAVATNFLQTAQKLEAVFEAQTDYDIDLVSGSTGQLYTQIINGAPYDAFLSADADRVTRLIDAGFEAGTTRFTYALGKIVLLGTENEKILISGTFRKLALANPDLAPYGVAGMEALKAVGVSQAAYDKIIYGQNVGQAFGFVKTGNADLGFVAQSQMREGDIYWSVPASYYDPIRQDALLLSRGERDEAAKAFMKFLQTSQARQLIKSAGYHLAEPA